MCRLPGFVLLVLLVAAAKIDFEEHAAVVDTQQSSQAGRQGRQADKAGRPGCFVLCLLLALALLSRFCTN